eukprot:scaffold1385_cov403-Prasinococcus_capsulatus_cf.AAC.2
MGIPVWEAPSEAEAECAALCAAGKVYAAATEDMDTLTFGSPLLARYSATWATVAGGDASLPDQNPCCRHLLAPAAQKLPVKEFYLAKVGHPSAQCQFIDLCILSGCDYAEKVDKMGGVTVGLFCHAAAVTWVSTQALKQIREHGSIEKILENMKDKSRIPPGFEEQYKEARKQFKEPEVTPKENMIDFKWEKPDEEGLYDFLVNKNGFNQGIVEGRIKKMKEARKKGSQNRYATPSRLM